MAKPTSCLHPALNAVVLLHRPAARGAGGVGLVESTHRARVRHRLAGPVGRRAESSIARTRLEDEIVEARIVKTKIHQPDGVH
jgi:hypothetical protein